MANVPVSTRAQRAEVIALAGVLGLGGLAIIYLAMRGQGGGLGGLAPLRPGEFMGEPFSLFLEGGTIINVPVGPNVAIAATRPQVAYIGPGRSTYSYFRIVQQQAGQAITVYGSGVAGIFVAPTTTQQTYDLVAVDQPQPVGCPTQALCAYPWPGVLPTPICGAPPQPGLADAVLEVYQAANLSGYPPDADGFSSPTCNGRTPVARKVYRNKIRFP